MTARGYTLFGAIFFALIAAAHIVRLILHIPIIMGGWEVPYWISYPAPVVFGAISALGFRASRR
jgi:hypothetical protein